jgi:cyclophilin family peptidyl-prolyl cis-trans isomerase/HEAT repeat protein
MLRTVATLAVLSLIATSLRAQGAHPDLAQLQRILVAEDARGTGVDGVTPLVNALQSTDTLLRRVAVRGLGRLQRPEFVPLIEPALVDSVPAVRAAAADALVQSLNRVPRQASDSGQVYVRSVALRLAAALDAEHDAAVADAIAEALGRLPFGDSLSAGPAQGAILHFAGDHLGFGAARGLYYLALNRRSTGGLSPNALLVLRQTLTPRSDAATRRVAVLTLTAGRALDSATVALAWYDPDVQVRRLALAGVTRVPPEFRSYLIDRAFRDSSAIVRIAAIGAARSGSRTPDCSRIITATTDPHPYVAQVAIDSLGAPCADSAAALAMLLQILKVKNPTRTEWVMHNHALIAWAHRGGVPAQFLAASAPQAQLAIAEAAGVLGDTATLLRLSASADHNVRESAIAGMSRVLRHGADSVYVAALSSPGYQVVLAAAVALKGSNDQHALPALLDNLDRLSRERRENSRDPRIAILARINEMGSAANRERLTPYLTDFDTLVATTVAKTLSHWSGSAIAAQPLPLPIVAEPLAATFLLRQVDLHVTLAQGGTFTLRLDCDNAPATAARILKLVQAHFYDGHLFQRVEPNFVVQGGGPDASEYMGDAQFMRDELSPRSHLRGTLGISSRGRDTGDAQWFFNLTDNTRLDHEYTVFGEVISGEAVVERMLEGTAIRSVVRR